MHNIDFKSVIIGVLITILVFVLIGADDTLDIKRIKAKSLIIEGEDGSIAMMGSMLVVMDKEDKILVSLGVTDRGHGVITAFNNTGTALGRIFAAKDGNGVIESYNKYGEKTTYIGNTVDGGMFEIYNTHNNKVVIIGADNNKEGVIGLFDKYSNLGWNATGH